MDAELAQIQLVMFSPGIVMANRLESAAHLNDMSSRLFDGDPVILPIPDDAPPEIPRIQLRSRDEQHSLSIAKNRVDYVIERRESTVSLSLPDAVLIERLLRFFGFMRGDLHADVTRAAVVTNWVVQLAECPAARLLMSTYIRDGAAFGDPHEIELHSLAKMSVAGLDSNFWTRIKSAHSRSQPKDNRYVTFQMDVNTLSEITNEFDECLLREFLNESSNLMNQTITKHLADMKEPQ